MCTSIAFQTKDFYFGRNMDLDEPFGERVLITPRRFPIAFRHEKELKSHYAMIGIAAGGENYPLYAEAVNEKGLCMAGLNFSGNACFSDGCRSGSHNIATYELIPWLLASCADVEEACALLAETNVTGEPYREGMPAASLHWHIADKKGSVVLEIMEDGMHIHRNPAGVVTNNPPFSFHLMNLNCYLNLTPEYPENRFQKELSLKPVGMGMGTMGMPGDASPISRFVRAAFYRANSVCGIKERESVSQLFHILDGVGMVKGAVRNPEGKCVYTTYACCINAEKGIYYYKTYEDSCIRYAAMEEADMEKEHLVEAAVRPWIE